MRRLRLAFAALAFTAAPVAFVQATDPQASGRATISEREAVGRFVARVNRLRREVGAPPLKEHPGLSRAAREHSLDLGRRGVVELRDRYGRSVGDRLVAFGVPYVNLGATAFAGPFGPEQAVDRWRRDRGVNVDLMDFNWRHIGVGYALGSRVGGVLSGGRFWTAVIARLAPDHGDLDALRGAVIARLNHHRRRHGLRPFLGVARLHEAAQIQADDMAQGDFMDHTGSDGSTVGDRVGRTGYRYAAVAENLAAQTLTATETVEAWMNSPGHRANILDPRLVEAGAGFANGFRRDARPPARTYWALALARRAGG